MKDCFTKERKFNSLRIAVIICLAFILLASCFAFQTNNSASADTGYSGLPVPLADNGEFEYNDFEPYMSTYYIKNIQMNGYLSLDNDKKNPEIFQSGVITELWDFKFGAGYQAWLIKKVEMTSSRTYYKIICYGTNNVLSVQAKYLNSDSKSIVQEPYNGEYRQQWYFEKVEGNGYVIRPRSGEAYSADWCLCAGFTLGGTNGLNVEQRKYKKDSDFKDTWWVCKYSDSVRTEAQERSNWCWAACVRMVAMRYMNPQITQSTLAYKIWKDKIILNPTEEQADSVNIGATVNQIVKALNYTLGFDGCYGELNKIYSEESLDALGGGNTYPFIAILGQYENGKRIYGHAVVVKNTYYSDYRGCLVCDIFDPMPLGKLRGYSCSYQALRNGNNVQGQWDYGNKNYMWDGIVIFKNVYGYSDTMPFTIQLYVKGGIK